MSSESKSIKIEKITKKFFGKCALNNVSFSASEGCTLGFVGPNGAGKTTLLSICNRLVIPTSGQVYINGKLVKDDPEFNRYLVFLPAEPRFPPISVKEYLSDCASLRDLPYQEVLQKVAKSPLSNHLHQLCNSLSTGQKKILQILTLSIVYSSVKHGLKNAKPKMTVILDEPFNGLDPTNRHNFIEKIKDWKKHGWTVIISSHNLHDIQILADYVVMIDKGKLVYTGLITDDIEKTYQEKFIKGKKETGLFEI